MRYVTTEAHRDFVSLEKEIAYISSYIELQKIRLTETVSIFFEVKGDSIGKEIAPLILIPFVENAFKHGVNPEEKSEISVQIFITEYEIELQVKNSIVSSSAEKEAHSGLGIENTQQRLQLLYPSKHLLTISKNEKEFSVLLNLKLV